MSEESVRPDSARLVLRAYPVLVTCEGCPAHGQAAREVGRHLDARGLAESAWLGAARDLPTVRAKVRSRYPVYALDACEKGCAQAWLAAQGVVPRGAFTLVAGARVEDEVDRLARKL